MGSGGERTDLHNGRGHLGRCRLLFCLGDERHRFCGERQRHRHGDCSPPADGPTLVASEEAGEVVVVGNTVVWDCGGCGSVHATSAECPGSTIWSIFDELEAVEPAGLRSIGGLLYWANGMVESGAFFSASPDPGATVTMITTGGYEVDGFAVVGSQLVWTDMMGESIQTMPLGGGNISVQSVAFPSGLSGPTAMTADSDLNVYWVDWNGDAWSEVETNMIRRMSPSGDVTTLATDQGVISDIKTDDQYIYWATSVGNSPDYSAHVRMMPCAGGSVIELASLPTSNGGSLFLDGKNLYWTARVMVTPGQIYGSGALSVVSTDGSAPSHVLVGNLVFPAGIYVDAQYVYWAQSSLGSWGTGRVMRVAKPQM